MNLTTPPYGTNHDKEVVTLTDSAWTARPNSAPKVHIFRAIEYSWKIGILVAGVSPGVSSFDYTDTTRK